jgi:RNA polymerase sigma-70 factor, ECF subfamily
MFALVAARLMGKKENIEGAFVHLIADHQSELRAFVTSLMPGSSDIDDVVQEANKVVWEKRGEFEIGTNFKAWMFSVAKFQVMAAWRDKKRKKEWGVPESVLIKLIDDALATSDNTNVPDHEILHECLQRLRPKDRGLILRRYFDGWRVKKVADEAGRGSDSVKMSLRRIRSLLGICIRRAQRIQEVKP